MEVFLIMENNFVEMLGQGIGQLRTLVEETRNHVLEPKMMEQSLQAFNGGISSFIQIITNPAVVIYDVDNKKHVAVGGEKWKLIDYLVRFGENNMPVFKCTNPMIFEIDSFTVNKECIEAALNDYEIIYDELMINVMNVNVEFGMCLTTQSNSEKINHMTNICNIFDTSYEKMKKYYFRELEVEA